MVTTYTLDSISAILTEYVIKNQELKSLNPSHPDFKILGRKLLGLATQMELNFGEKLEEILTDAYDEYCPDNEISNINEYLNGDYLSTGLDANGSITYDFKSGSGISVSVDEYEGKSARFVINPNPIQLVLDIEKEPRKIVWSL
jgi:hypothetical protein